MNLSFHRCFCWLPYRFFVRIDLLNFIPISKRLTVNAFLTAPDTLLQILFNRGP